MDLGGLPLPSRFFLAPLAGYTSLAYPAGVRELRRAGAGDDRPGQRPGDPREAAAVVRAGRDLRRGPAAVDPDLWPCRSTRCSRPRGGSVDHGATIVDINMGCPVNKVVKTRRRLGPDVPGRRRDRPGRRRSSRPWTSPVTVKMRLGWDDDDPDGARPGPGVRAGRRGGRDRPRPDPRAGVQGRGQPRGIRAVVEAVESIPVVGNGDIRTLADAEAMFARDRLRGDLDRPGRPVEPVPLPPARPLGRARRPRPRTDVRRAGRPDGRPLPRAGRAPGRAARLPPVPQDPQVVQPRHPARRRSCTTG